MSTEYILRIVFSTLFGLAALFIVVLKVWRNIPFTNTEAVLVGALLFLCTVVLFTDRLIKGLSALGSLIKFWKGKDS